MESYVLFVLTLNINKDKDNKMVRIAGIDLPRKKKINFGLTAIYGIGLPTANKILTDLNIDVNIRVNELNDNDVSKIRQLLEDSFQIEGDLRRIKSQSIKRLIEISCYRGRRHIQNLPVRGQRTRTNARTKRGSKKTVAKKKK